MIFIIMMIIYKKGNQHLFFVKIITSNNKFNNKNNKFKIQM